MMTIDTWFDQFERGTLSRRQLAQALFALAGAAAFPAAAEAQSSSGTAINHVQLTVADLKRSGEVYAKTVGAKFQKAYGESVHTLALPGGAGWVSLRQGKEKVGQMDHFAVSMDNWDAERVEKTIKAALPSANVTRGGTRSVFLVDPDGFKVQLIDKNDNGG